MPLKKIITSLALFLFLAVTFGCEPSDPGPDQGKTYRVVGVYRAEATPAELKISSKTQNDDVSGAVVRVYQFEGDGNERIVAGQDGSVLTDYDGTFTIDVPVSAKNILVEVTKNGVKKKFIILDAGSGSSNSLARYRIFKKLIFDNSTDNSTGGSDDVSDDNSADDSKSTDDDAGSGGIDNETGNSGDDTSVDSESTDNSTGDSDDVSDDNSIDDSESNDNGTSSGSADNETTEDSDDVSDTDNGTNGDNAEYIIVDAESDVEAEVIIDEIAEEGTDLEDIDTEDIDEIIDGDIAEAVQDNETIRDCVIRHIRKARKIARELFVGVLKDRDFSQEEIDDIEGKLKDAHEQVRPLRKELRKTIYDILQSDAEDKLLQIEAAVQAHREKVMEIISQVGIPPALYLKARHMATEAFEKAIMKSASDCSFPSGLRNRIIRRALLRKVLEDIIQTKHILKNTFDYDNASAMDSEFNMLRETIRAFDKDEDNRQEIRSAIREFYKSILNHVKAAVDDDLVSDDAIRNVVRRIRKAENQLNEDIMAADNPEEIKAAYKNFNTAFRAIVAEEFELSSDDDPEIRKKKLTLSDLLFNIST